MATHNQPHPRWPLNESQRRTIAITLAGIERDLHQIAAAARQHPRDSRMVRYVEPVPAEVAATLRRSLAEIQRQLGQIADDLHLPPQEDSITRLLTSALLLDEVAVEEIEPRRLRGYGEVDADTAAYLNRELPKLRAQLAALGQLLARPPS